MKGNIRLRVLALAGAAATISSTALADIVWTGAVDNDVFSEANWDLTNSAVTAIDPNVAILDNVVIVGAAQPVEVPAVGGGQFRLQVGEGFTMTIDSSTVICLGDDAIGSDPGTGIGITIDVVNGTDFRPFFVTNMCDVRVDATSQITFGGGGNPVNGSTVDLTFGATLAFVLEDPTEFASEHLSKITVDGLPAVDGLNIAVVSDGATGTIVTVLQQGLGTNYCDPAAVNSTGVPSTISASGSASAATNNVTLTTVNMPNGSFGYYLTSMSQGNTPMPNGSLGTLCLGGSIGRYIGPGQIMNSGATGMISLTIDLTQHPTPTGLVTVAGGETWNFQMWHRDVVAGNLESNFSNGLEILFN